MVRRAPGLAAKEVGRLRSREKKKELVDGDVILTQTNWNTRSRIFAFFSLTLSIVFKPQKSRSVLKKASVTQCLYG